MEIKLALVGFCWLSSVFSALLKLRRSGGSGILDYSAINSVNRLETKLSLWFNDGSKSEKRTDIRTEILAVSTQNRIGDEIYKRILRAHKAREVFRVYVVIPLLPGFESEVGGTTGTSLHAITHWNYSSISRTEEVTVNTPPFLETPRFEQQIILGFCTPLELSVPIINDNISNKLEDLDDVEVIDDDFTTRSLERLSSAATCLVAGIEYTHGQQINRIDPCEFCLCLDGEMFCWWQDCPPATDGPCKDQGPFSQCDNVIATKAPSSPDAKVQIQKNTTKSNNAKASEQNFNKQNKNSTSNMLIKTTRSDTSIRNSENSTAPSESTSVNITSVPKFCNVMGVQYRIGDKLPHDTGNCIECICGEGAKIACSPHQCAPLGEEINDYRPPEPRLAAPDSF